MTVKAVLCPVVANVYDHLPGDSGDVNVRLGADLAHAQDHTGGAAGFTSHSALRILFQDRIQNGIGDLVTDLVRMSLSDRFGRKKFFHVCIPPYNKKSAQYERL